MKNGKTVIKNVNGKMHLSIPSKKNWFVLGFSIFWLTGWVYGFYSVGRLLHYHLVNDNVDYFLVIWLLSWFLGGSSVISFVGWGLFGKEKLTIDKDTVKFQKTVLGLGKRRTIPKSEIENLREHQTCGNLFSGCRLIPYSQNTGKIRFDHGMRSYSFGLVLDQPEVTELMSVLQTKLSEKSHVVEEEITGIQYEQLFRWKVG